MKSVQKRERRNPIKSEAQIARMREAGLLVWQAHQVAAALVRPGIRTADIDAAVERFILDHGAVSLFQGVVGEVPFPAATCISVNQEVVHGIPGPRVLREGDIVSIDIGVRLNGWCGDAAVTHPVGVVSPVAQMLLDVTKGALQLAIRAMGEKRLWSQVAAEIERYVTEAGFSVVEDLAGHSIGRDLWEGLQAPNYVSPEFVRKGDFALEPGLVIAVEPMVNVGGKDVRVQKDHWTIVTEDSLPSAHFEHTIAITPHGPQVLTAGPE